MPESDVVTFNVSGKISETLRSTILKYPDTYLGNLVQSNLPEYFIARSPLFFGHILNYYRTELLHFPEDVCMTAFDEELSFYGLSAELFCNCFIARYRNRRLTSQPTDGDKNSTGKPLHLSVRICLSGLDNLLSSKTGLIWYFFTNILIAVSIIPQNNMKSSGEEAFYLFVLQILGIVVLCAAILTFQCEKEYPESPIVGGQTAIGHSAITVATVG
ncbi:potassium voltage-gated channel subfamily D member 1-like [Paramacrobiotus metropolitanus]|uniref:potassium voltage-gated channel subfamily D member 1-like n=1 Tax=Paramacrobiotus metropolitanus TaxID=2943436 RepID=UPI0024459756|nr:potassium voltage-gated channel subfamily D member 1-like [Paramacrobiotus metropolitanus]